MSGNANYVLEQLDNGLVDFGLVFGEADEKKYNVLHIPKRERWGVLLRRDDPLAQKEKITPEDLRDQPLIVSAQEDARKQLAE
ncbi:LysR family transcriptional regulator substrate-binding protein [Catenisphaera adipataccumulans]|uniref:DNA-binding transcriptional LysR family regulator n=1 Tax=Catenisphaera adipataccumulans TaxID=700500 RepID=A0A7W8FUZ7_9FIRM|nr:LysR family transcriptional regulator substrate-binding protein [Catenisphaera adipataccumulans]MBB5182618.1 DNA-binding transcriptional LysR family regulator [Catenisphaera adipataccumulans]